MGEPYHSRQLPYSVVYYDGHLAEGSQHGQVAVREVTK